jgi:hypothetical protein
MIRVIIKNRLIAIQNETAKITGDLFLQVETMDFLKVIDLKNLDL